MKLISDWEQRPANGSGSEIRAAQAFQRKAEFYLNFVEAGHSSGLRVVGGATNLW